MCACGGVGLAGGDTGAGGLCGWERPSLNGYLDSTQGTAVHNRV